MKYLDTHSHIHDHYYDADRTEVLARMQDVGVATVAVGTSLETSHKAHALSIAESHVWACVGVHPNDTTEPFNAINFESLLGPRTIAIGECGLDYFRGADDSEKRRQKNNFEAQIAFAQKHSLPLMLHVRASKGTQDAHDDALEMLQATGFAGRGTSHFFTAPLDIANKYWNIGFATSFPGVITFAKDTREVVAEAPADLYFAETDAPYATPVPYRGQRNEPIRVIEVVKKIAEIRGESESEVVEQLGINARSLFGLAL